MNLRAITPLDAERLMEAGAILIDIREADEHARERIPGARHVPLSKLDEAAIATQRRQTVIFHCRSGARTRSNSARLAARVGDACEVYLVYGGLDAWRNAGLPIDISHGRCRHQLCLPSFPRLNTAGPARVWSLGDRHHRSGRGQGRDLTVPIVFNTGGGAKLRTFSDRRIQAAISD